MKILVGVKAGARENSVEKIADGEYKVSVRAAAEKGKANAEVILALAEYFGIPRASVRIKAGHTARRKIIEIDK